MTGERTTTQEGPGTPFEGTPFAAMMSQMMSQQGVDCGCAGMMSQMMGRQGTLGSCAEMMSPMMAMCGGAQVPDDIDEVAKEMAQEA